MKDLEGQTILEVGELNVTFPNHHVVKDLTISIRRGETLGIVGRTGSGKTLAMLSLLNLHPHESQKKTSHFRFAEGQEVSQCMPEKIAFVFQNAQMSLNPVVKCGKQVSRVIRKNLKKDRNQAAIQVKELFSECGINDVDRVFNAYPHQVSGGELQRIMIAMGLSCTPDLLILDEPTASLDKIIQSKIIRLLQKLKKSHQLTLVVISHDLEMIAKLAERVIHIDKGRKIADQSTEDFFIRPENEVSRSFIETLKTFRKGAYATKSNTPSIISIRDVHKRFENGKTALKNIDLEIFKHEKLGIVGESGSGKSTLAKCIAGIEVISSGQISTEVDRGDISYVYQDAYNSVDPDLTIYEIIHEVLRLQRNSPSFEELLLKVQLDPSIRNRKIHELSGGQRQRVNLARGLASNPKVLICDEITSGLDVNVQLEIVDLLAYKMKEITVIFISHDISLVKYFCHRVMILKEGSMVNVGETQQIFEKSDNNYTIDLINSASNVKYFLNI